MNLSDLIVSDIASVHELYNAKDASMRRVARERFAMCYKYEGETLYTTKDGELSSSKNKLVFLPKNSNYEWKCTESGHFITVEFDAVKELDEKLFTVDIKDPETMLKKFRELLKKHLQNAPLPEILSLFYGIIANLIADTRDTAYTPKSKSERIRPALEYINSKYSEEISNASLAALCGISEVYFRKLFFAVEGMSPIHYLHRIRIARAKEMLDSDFGKIGDVGEAVGYSSIYHFSKMFKFYTGISPKEYIKSSLSEEK